MITKVLGDVPVVKILDFLQESIPHDFTKAEIEKLADVGYTELRRDFDCLLKSNMVVETRRIGGVQLYTLNNDHLIVAAVMDFCKAISVVDQAVPSADIGVAAIIDEDEGISAEVVDDGDDDEVHDANDVDEDWGVEGCPACHEETGGKLYLKQ